MSSSKVGPASLSLLLSRTLNILIFTPFTCELT